MAPVATPPHAPRPCWSPSGTSRVNRSGSSVGVGRTSADRSRLSMAPANHGGCLSPRSQVRAPTSVAPQPKQPPAPPRRRHGLAGEHVGQGVVLVQGGVPGALGPGGPGHQEHVADGQLEALVRDQDPLSPAFEHQRHESQSLGTPPGTGHELAEGDRTRDQAPAQRRGLGLVDRAPPTPWARAPPPGRRDRAAPGPPTARTAPWPTGGTATGAGSTTARAPRAPPPPREPAARPGRVRRTGRRSRATPAGRPPRSRGWPGVRRRRTRRSGCHDRQRPRSPPHLRPGRRSPAPPGRSPRWPRTPGRPR